MTKVVQQHHHVALLCQRVPNTGKGRAGIEAVGRQFSHVVIKKHAIALGQLTLAEACVPAIYRIALVGSPSRWSSDRMAVNSAKEKATIASGVRWKAVTRPVTEVLTSTASSQARWVLDSPSLRRTALPGVMPTTFPPAGKGRGGEIMPAGGVQKDAAITTYDEVGDLAAQVVVDPSATFTGGDFVAASKVERLEVERSEVAPQHYAGSRRIMTAHGIRDLYESGCRSGELRYTPCTFGTKFARQTSSRYSLPPAVE